MTTPTLDDRLLKLHPDDNTAAARCDLTEGDTITIDGRAIPLTRAAPAGHKIAVAPIATGQKVLKYGAPIGSATTDIQPGEHVHTHNVKSDYLPTYERGETT